ncbi:MULTISPECIES: hypothetical protein [Aphanothece]|uniref:hypothetical protein n=1 Tax=Aphanothece TaxID=1121 RepID=UPI00398F74C1
MPHCLHWLLALTALPLAAVPVLADPMLADGMGEPDGGPAAPAEQPSPEAGGPPPTAPRSNEVSSEAETESLAASSQNPIADLISVPFQNNTTFGLNPPGVFDVSNGGLDDVFNFDAEQLRKLQRSLDPQKLRQLRKDLRNYDDETLNVLNIQPVIPIKLSDDLTLVTRTIVPVVSKPTVRQGQVWGLGDINPTFFVVPSTKGPWTVGVGPTVLLPTATNDVLGTGKWSAGPAAVAVYTRGPWVAGGLVSQIWSFAGEGDRGSVSSFLVQPFLNYNLPGGWYLTSSPVITANWERARDQWTVPLGGGVGRIFTVGGQPMSVALEGYGNVAKPSGFGDFTARVTFKLLFPKKGG